MRTAGNGSVICLNNGSYGALTIDAQRSGYVTLKSVNPLGAVFSEINLDNASFIRLEQLKVTGEINNARDNTNNIHVIGNDVTGVSVWAPARLFAGPGPSDWLIEYNDIHDCDFCVGILSANPDNYWPVSNVIVRGNKLGPMNGGDDAIRINNFRNLVFEDNEIFGVIEDGQHNDCLQSVWGGQGLVFAGNYLHDNNCQTFFLKDGYTEDIVFENNLSVRNRAGTAAPVSGQIWNSRNVLVRNNTIWDESALLLRSGSTDPIFPQGGVEDYEVTNNVIVDFVPYDDAQPPDNRAGIFKDPSILTEDYNVFGGGWTWVPDEMGSHSVQDSSPNFINPTTNPTDDLASGDWRLANSITKGGQTYTAGITWKLAGRRFGIDAYGSGSGGSGSGPASFAEFVTGDFDNDGRDEVAAFSKNDGTWWVFDAEGSSMVGSRYADVSASGWKTVRAGDFNGDGKDDVAMFNTSGDWWVGVSNGSSFQFSEWANFSTSSGWKSQMVGDFNGDGKDDIANFHPWNGTWWVSRSTGSGFSTRLWADFSTAWGWQSQIAGDFNGDGKDDIANFHPSNGTWWVSRSTGSGFSTRLWADFSTPSGWKSQIAGDFNGDGKDDIANFHPSNGTWWVSRSTGGSFSTRLWADYTTASGWSPQLVGDFNGDGKDDIANFHSSNGTWWVSRSNGSSFSTYREGTVAPPSGWKGQLVGDYDGDGDDDLSNFRPSTRSWTIS